jgi:molecular chaperone DnaK
MNRIVGIDLGTTNSLVAVMEGGKPIIIPNLLGNHMTPSVVRILANGNYIVGENAVKALVSDPRNTISGIKRFIGRHYNEVIDLVTTLPFHVVLGNSNLAVVNIHGIDYTPQVISAMILQYLKASAENYLGQKVTQAVITVPAYFSDLQRQSTKEAGLFAGLEILRIINEPTAASLAYGFDLKESKTIAIFDLGGGTFDITIQEIGEGVFEVMSIEGDGFLGGDDFDNMIVEWILEETRLDYGTDLSGNIFALQRILEVAKKAKHEISQLSEVQIQIPYLVEKEGVFIDLEMILTRSKFDEFCEELFARLVFPCNQAMQAALIAPKNIDEVILVGGATRMKNVAAIIQKVFNVEPKRSVNPDEVVAIGAAIQAGIISGDVHDKLLLDITPHSLGLEGMDGTTVKIVRKNTTIPTLKSEVFSTLTDNQTSVEIHILEGSGVLALDNRTLGRFILDGIPPAPKGVPQIEVTFDIDVIGILNVKAKDKGTGKEKSMRIELSIKRANNELDSISEISSMNLASIEKMQA